MTLTAKQEQSIRDYLLPQALKREASMRVGQAWSTVLATIAAGFFFGGLFLSITTHWFFDVPKDVPLMQWFENISVYPTSVFMAFAIMGFLMNKENEVMPLHYNEAAQLEVPEGVWNNLGVVGRTLLIVFGSIAALGLFMLVVAIIF
ncbi:hypothetical protein CL652_00305 [bacterium]|nr:hypothetical protein [bacterium]|tara:strand:+ start:379 stop:819 length:441 start_codon:yes stop_codon:yes gene_type:complete